MVIKEGAELGVVRELEARSLVKRDVGCDAEESILTVGEAEWGSTVTGEGGSVPVADIEESRAGEAWRFPLQGSAIDSEFRSRRSEEHTSELQSPA